jgi:hypothetical protein
MRALTPVIPVAVGLLVAATASADDGAAAPPAATPMLAAPPVPGAPIAPAYPMYPPPSGGAPPPYWRPIAPATERRSTTLRTTGIVLFAVGGAASFGGVALFASVSSSGCADDGTGRNPCSIAPVVPLLVAAAGAVTGLAGIPLFVIGAQRVPVGTATGKLVPELTVGAANGSLRWSF